MYLYMRVIYIQRIEYVQLKAMNITREGWCKSGAATPITLLRKFSGKHST